MAAEDPSLYKLYKRPRWDAPKGDGGDGADRFGEMWGVLEQTLADKKFQIPPLPRISVALNRMANDPDADLNEVLSLIERDVQMSAKLMRVACSPAYTIRKPPRNLRDAVLRIGLTGLRNIALSVTVGGVFRCGELNKVMGVEFRHSFAVACGTARICKHVGVDPHDGFLCGLMHDIGRIALLAAIAKAGQKQAAWMEPEFIVTALDAFHTRVGVEVMERWELPEPTGAVAGAHHGPDAAAEENQGICRVVSVVDDADKLRDGELDERVALLEQHSCAAQLGLPREELVGVIETLDHAHADVGLLIMTT